MSNVPVMHSDARAGGASAELPTARVHDIFVRALDIEVPSEDTDLIDSGLLDSLALVSLIMELETEFDLTVSYDELEIDHFRTLRSIAAFVVGWNRS